MALLQKTQTDFTDSDVLGVGEPIEYFHKKTFTSEDVRAFVSDDIYNNPSSKTRVSESVFSSVLLDFPPEENDEITYDDRVYKVKVWTQSQNRYIIIAEHKRHHKATRVKV